jgi:hypothetical protein
MATKVKWTAALMKRIVEMRGEGLSPSQIRFALFDELGAVPSRKAIVSALARAELQPDHT